MESGSANIFRLFFTTEKVHFKQTNILSIKRHQDYKIAYRRDHACIFRAFFVTSYRFYFTKLNFLRRRCREINNKLNMTLNDDVSGLMYTKSSNNWRQNGICVCLLQRYCYRVTDVLLPNFEFLGYPLTVLINKN